MKSHTFTFLIGFALGLTLALGISQIPREPVITPTVESARILDEMINAWTRPSEIGLASIFCQPGRIPDTVRILALQLEQTYLIPKGVTIAQWILESGWGSSDIGAMNYFGHTYEAVKKYMPHPDFVIARERTWLKGKLVLGGQIRFARYRSMQECFEVHGLYVSCSPLFHSAFAQRNAESFAWELAPHYAVDPDYGLKLVILIRRYHLA